MTCTHNCNQGRACSCSTEASRRPLGITGDPMESSTVRWFAVLMVLIVLCAIFTRSYPQ